MKRSLITTSLWLSLLVACGVDATAPEPAPEAAEAAAPETATVVDGDDHGACLTRPTAVATDPGAPPADAIARRGADAKVELAPTLAATADWTPPPVGADVIARQAAYFAAADALATQYPDDEEALAQARASLKAAMLP